MATELMSCTVDTNSSVMCCCCLVLFSFYLCYLLLSVPVMFAPGENFSMQHVHKGWGFKM